MSSRISAEFNHPRKKQEEGKSMLSNSSGGSSTLMDVVSQNQKRQKSVTQSNQQQNLRKFTSAISKPGQARETRELISRVLSTANPMRPPLFAEPIDYERFITEKSAQLENDRDRDLLLFFRDDISGSEVYPRERTAVPTVRHRDINETDWLLPRDALKFYISPYIIINFNYAKFAGEFKKFDPSQNLNFLRFESDMIFEEEKSQFAEQTIANEILREGNMIVLPGESIVDSFKSEKKRYCILRRSDEGKIYIEIYKQASMQQQQIYPPMEIKSAQIKGTKKGKTLQITLTSTDSEKNLILSTENESDLQFWLFEIDRAITWRSKDIITSEDNTSLNSSFRENSIPMAQDSESMASEESIGSRDSITMWRGKNSAAKALQPPIVERNSIFSLYWDMEPLLEPDGEKSTLNKSLNEIESGNAKKIQQISPLFAQPKKSTSMISAFTDDGAAITSIRDVSPDPSTSDFLGEKPAILFTTQIRQLDIKTRFACKETPEQIEPFFLRLFIFDASNGTRLSEEFHIEVPVQRFTELRSSSAIIASKQILPERIHGISRNRIQAAERLICAIQNPRPDLYLVAFIERILSDIPVDIYLKNNAIDTKTSVKIQKSISASFLRLNHLRTLFAWTATPIFPSLCPNRNFTMPNSNVRNCPIYKSDGKLTDIDIQKLLNDLQKPEKVAKWISFPGANLTLEADVTSVLSQIPMRISPNYFPLRPWRVTTTPDNTPLSPSFELQSFTDQKNLEPQRGFTNLLYVYPILLNYSTQKSFPKARNISCKVRFVKSKIHQTDNFFQTHPIYNRIDPNGPLVQSINCAVQYHESAPAFNEEVKIQLPPSLDQTDHLLFTFSHISLATALSNKQSQANDPYETVIGYSWLSLSKENEMGLPNLIMSKNYQEFDLPIAANLPQNYIEAKMMGGKEGGSMCSNADIKLVEGGKHLFRVCLRLISTIFTTEERIQNFFQLCHYTFPLIEKMSAIKETTKNMDSVPKMQQKIYNSPGENACSASDLQEKLSPNHEQSLNFELELINTIEQLTMVDISQIIPFIEVILNRLFSLITLSRTPGLAISALSAIIKLVDCLYMSRKSRRDILHNYIRLHFNAMIAPENDENELETLHGAILRFLPSLLQRCRENTGNELPRLFRQLWFLLDCVTKSMAHWLILSNLIKAPRSLRFPNELYFSLEEFFKFLTQQIVEKQNEFKTESRLANLALAHFLNFCLSLMDRHQIMKELFGIVKRMDAVDSRNFRIYKFELLQILSWHEHWIPLCLPILTDKYGIVMRGDTIMFEGFTAQNQQNLVKNTGGGFFSKLFSHIFSPPYAPHESNEIERYSTSYCEHFYLSETYCSTHFLIGLLFQELNNSLRDSRDYRRKIIRLVRNLLVKHYRDQRYGDTSAKNRIAILYLPFLRFIIEHIRELEATIKGKNDSPMHSPIMGAKGNSTDRYSSLTSNSADLFRSKLNIPSHELAHDGNSSLCKSTLTANSFNSQSTMTKESIKIGKEKTNPVVVVLAEKLDKSEVRDLLISALYLLNNLPKKILAAFWNTQDSIQIQSPKKGSKKSEEEFAEQQPSTQSLLLDFIRFLEFAMLTFRYRGRSYHIMQQTKRAKSKSSGNFNSVPYDSYKSFGTGAQFSTLTDFADSIGHSAEEDNKDSQNGLLMDCHLSQEVALIILEAVQIISNQVAAKTKFSSSKYYDAIFFRLLNLKLQMLNDEWSETVRLQTLASLAVFINLFSTRFFHTGPLDCLSTLVKALLLQLNSRIPRIQNSAAALIQLILRGGFDASNSYSTKLSSTDFSANQKNQPNYSAFVTEKLGRPGAQISVALARLLSEKKLETYRFERGLTKIESLVAGDKHSDATSSLIVTSLFERAVLELVKQLRGVLDATKAITDMTNNPIQLADLHIQLADSYRGSAALRSEFFDALANIHISEGWYSEGAVCQAHSLAIIGKELQAKKILNADWSLLGILNETIALEEEMKKNNTGSTQQGGFTLDEFTRKVEDLVRTLILSERYEAVGPIYRLTIPIFEYQFDFKALMEIYAELQQASSRAAEIKINGKRHLGSYFKVVFYGQNHFGDEHKTEWIYREPRLTSLAEACDRMVEAVRLALGHDQVRIMNERMDNEGKKGSGADKLDTNIAHIQVAYVEPCQSEEILRKLKNGDGANEDKLLEKINDPMNYSAHTNVRIFILEEKLMDAKVGEMEPEMARTALRRLILTVENSFPNTRRRQRITRTEEMILTPLELACESLLFKASQIRRILAAADVPKAHFGVYDKETLKRLDLKQLQLFLQGSVSPTVNAGLLAYAEAFTAPAQKQRYGKNGIGRLVSAFKTLIAELDDALRVNEAAMAGERAEYQGMLRQSFDGMLERLSMFFDGEKFLQRPGAEEKANAAEKEIHSLGVFGNLNRTGSSAEMHIFDSISGLNG